LIRNDEIKDISVERCAGTIEMEYQNASNTYFPDFVDFYAQIMGH